ncbi:type III-B CRISPR module RAMP protein Cmr1 [Kingella negevensis]|nr:type III-B CRISPR module RAMP protein Cmr1 [Kingella negevensis]MDK4685388.1 type III-B CRISPR module RAMP protein Cmr1 [Kingella negevensis]MDK4697626.1 type III-B CRISPR module RAMP protein Cmr1 [Kingella negevensis]MDK4706867.1 type III-B CRISPR module RAMP protein Cmr1 [Kingella negevensis]MDK4710447.1 type III-B CRISPR module RAMP protein Cmr1 [Kingella negevensis]
MALREIPNIPIPKIEDYLDKIQETHQWKTMKCKLVTPIHGGGVEARSSDKDLPIRVAAIRGQLRFWWRLLAKHKPEWGLSEKSAKEFREQEFVLWGGMADGEDGGNASLVFLRVKVSNKLEDGLLKNYISEWNERKRKEETTVLSYALFTARKETTNHVPEMTLGKEGLMWTLQWRFSEKISDMQKEQVSETLRWWATLGGIGGRTRRGCGAFEVENVKLVSLDEMEALGCEILSSKNKDKLALQAWSESISSWKDIRKANKTAFKQLFGKEDNTRHLATVFSRPVKVGNQWRGVVVMLPNSSNGLKAILGKK